MTINVIFGKGKYLWMDLHAFISHSLLDTSPFKLRFPRRTFDSDSDVKSENY